MKHVNDACNNENHFNGGIISSDCESSSAEEETIFSLSRKITSILDSAWLEYVFSSLDIP